MLIYNKVVVVVSTSQSSHAAGLEKIMLEKENIASQIELLRGVLDKKKDHILKLATSSLSLREKTSELTSSTQSPDPRTMYELSLYKKVSGIQWDYSAPAGRLAGRKFSIFDLPLCKILTTFGHQQSFNSYSYVFFFRYFQRWYRTTPSI